MRVSVLVSGGSKPKILKNCPMDRLLLVTYSKIFGPERPGAQDVAIPVIATHGPPDFPRDL